MRKPHAGIVQFCVVFPDGDHYVWREIEYHSQAKINDNQTSGVPGVPTGWRIEEHGQVTVPARAIRASSPHSLSKIPSRTDVSEGHLKASISKVTVTLDAPALQDTVVDYMVEVQA